MSTTTKLYGITVSHRDGSFSTTPEPSIEAGLLTGMVEAAKWAMTKQGQSIAWTEITDRFVKGVMTLTGQRVVVMWADLPMAAEDTLIEWMFEEDNA